MNPFFNNWIIMALLSSIAFGLGDFLVVKLTSESNLSDHSIFLFYTLVLGLLVVFYFVFSGRTNDYLKMLTDNTNNIYSLIIISFSMLLAYYFHYRALISAPNPGYANSLIVFHVIVLTLLSHLFLGKSLNIMAFLGIILTILGVTIVIEASG